MRKKLWIILLVVGTLPFIVSLTFGIYSSISGFSGLCWWQCNYDYGFKAFFDSILLFSYIFWPAYIIGTILIILSAIKIKNKK